MHKYSWIFYIFLNILISHGQMVLQTSIILWLFSHLFCLWFPSYFSCIASHLSLNLQRAEAVLKTSLKSSKSNCGNSWSLRVGSDIELVKKITMLTFICSWVGRFWHFKVDSLYGIKSIVTVKVIKSKKSSVLNWVKGKSSEENKTEICLMIHTVQYLTPP